jgi:hypothetical protein
MILIYTCTIIPAILPPILIKVFGEDTILPKIESLQFLQEILIWPSYIKEEWKIYKGQPQKKKKGR